MRKDPIVEGGNILVDISIFWITGAVLFGVTVGFLTGASKRQGTGKAVAVALLGSGVFTGILAIAKDTETAGIFLTGFFGAFIVGLGVGLWYRQGKHGPELFRESITSQPRTSQLT